MNTTTIYVAYKNSDMTEGKGPLFPDQYFMRREDAVEYLNSKYYNPSNRPPPQWENEKYYGFYMLKEIKVNNSSLIQDQKRMAQIKYNALAKLTGEEIIALGLSAK